MSEGVEEEKGVEEGGMKVGSTGEREVVGLRVGSVMEQGRIIHHNAL